MRRLGLIAIVALAAPVWGQVANFVFSYRSTLQPTPIPVLPSGAIQFGNQRLGTTGNVDLIVENRSTVGWTILEVTISGPPFGLVAVPTGTGTDLVPGDVRRLTLSFTPRLRGPVDGALIIKVQPRLSTTDPGQGPGGDRITSFIFFLAGTGLAPELVQSYILSADGNQVIVANNDTINFPPTEVLQTATGTFVITNRGNGPGTVTRVTLTAPSTMRLSGVPLLPALVEPARDVRFSFLFSPLTQERVSGTLRIEFEEGQPPLTLLLTGQGTGATYVYEFLQESGTIQVAPNGTFTVPTTTVGTTASVNVRVRNTGNGTGRLSNIAASGTGFAVANLPFLPATVPAGQAVTFTVAFAPTLSGPAEGRLRIDDAVINLAGTGLGSTLIFGVRQGTTVTPLPVNGTVSFPNTTVGTRSSQSVVITNTGNTVARVASINLTGDPFTLDRLPTLPASLDPGQAVEFTIQFLPTGVGAANGSVQVDLQRINVAGVGVLPPPLPAVNYSGATGTVEPGVQPAAGITIAQAYPLDITGRLALSFTSDAFSDDPAIQFSTGGRTINFTIPAGSTTAVFGRDQTEVQFQTGTVAGTITLGATFTTGAVDLTPVPAPVKTLTVPGAAPRLRGVQIGSRSATSFEVVVTGFSTLRSVTDLALQFAAAAGGNLQTSSLSVNVDVPFSTWYRGGGSVQFGSQFTAVIAIQVSGDINAVQSVTVTASNARGASAPVSVNLR
jgi:hypothetical protein